MVDWRGKWVVGASCHGTGLGVGMGFGLVGESKVVVAEKHFEVRFLQVAQQGFLLWIPVNPGSSDNSFGFAFKKLIIIQTCDLDFRFLYKITTTNNTSLSFILLILLIDWY